MISFFGVQPKAKLTNHHFDGKHDSGSILCGLHSFQGIWITCKTHLEITISEDYPSNPRRSLPKNESYAVPSSLTRHRSHCSSTWQLRSMKHAGVETWDWADFRTLPHTFRGWRMSNPKVMVLSIKSVCKRDPSWLSLGPMPTNGLSQMPSKPMPKHWSMPTMRTTTVTVTM